MRKSRNRGKRFAANTEISVHERLSFVDSFRVSIMFKMKNRMTISQVPKYIAFSVLRDAFMVYVFIY